MLGAQERLEFTVLGDVVNVAARIEQMTKQSGTSLVAAEPAVIRAGEAGGWQEVGREVTKGRSGTVQFSADISNISLTILITEEAQARN